MDAMANTYIQAEWAAKNGEAGHLSAVAGDTARSGSGAEVLATPPPAR